MSASVTGTPSAVDFGSATDPTGQSVTIPGDATAAYLFWSYYHSTGGDGHGLASATLGGNAPAQVFEAASTPTVNTCAGVAVWYSPVTGSTTLDVAWDASPDEGPNAILVYVKDGDLSAWRDADALCAEGSDPASVTLSTLAGDLVLKLEKGDGTVPDLTAGWTSAQTQTVVGGGDSARVSYIVATGSTEVCAAETPEYPGVAAVSIPAGGGGAVNAIPIIDYYYRMIGAKA